MGLDVAASNHHLIAHRTSGSLSSSLLRILEASWIPLMGPLGGPLGAPSGGLGGGPGGLLGGLDEKLT